MLKESVNVINDAKFVGGSSFRGLKPLTIFFEDDPVLVANVMMHQPKLIVEVSSLFPYTDNKMVPLNYNCNYVHESASANILKIGGMTRSGRCYMLATIEVAPSKPVEEIPQTKKNKKWSHI